MSNSIVWRATLALVIAAAPVPSNVTAAEAPPATTPSAEQPGPARFYGTIGAVDLDAKTFTVDKQTYTIVPESQVTKAADDKPATLADAVVGEMARGSYTRTSDGKLHVTKVRFGKKSGGSGAGKAGGKKDKDAAAATKPAPKE